jgi:hypothetical protein
MTKVIRITRHPADDARIEALRTYFGEDTEVITDDVPYGDDPVGAVVGLLQKYSGTAAIEVVAPIPVLAKLTNARRELGDVLILRAEFQKGADGRAVVVSKDANGRDVFGFSHYEIVERVVVQTRKLGDK